MVQHNYLRLVSLLFIAMLVSCRNPASEVVRTETLSLITTATATASLTPTPYSTQTHTPLTRPPASETPIETAQPTAAATPTLTLTATTTHTPRPTSTPSATPEPAHLAFAQAVETADDHFFSIDYNGRESFQSPLNPQQLDYYRPRSFVNDSVLAYEDLNRDGVLDVIVYSHKVMAIFLNYGGENYAPPIIFAAYDTGYKSAIRYAFEDWTHNGADELVLNYFYYHHLGTGVWAEAQRKTIIRCVGFNCHIIWKYTPVYVMNYSDGDGIAIGTDFVQTADHTQAYQSFQTKDQYFNLNAAEVTYSWQNTAIFTSTMYTAEWTGQAFRNTGNRTITAPYQPLTPAPVLSTTALSGHFAEIILTGEFHTHKSQYCHLSLNQQSIGYPFICNKEFTSVEWQDVLQDGADELVIKTMAGITSYIDNLPTDQRLDCVHQRMIIWRDMGAQWMEIANVAGCVRDNDLLGVRLEETNQNQSMEIITADTTLWQQQDCLKPDNSFYKNCWSDFNQDILLYRWDGLTFQMAERIQPSSSNLQEDR